MGSAAAAVRPRSVTIVLAAAAALGVFAFPFAFAFAFAFVWMAGLSRPSCCSFRLFWRRSPASAARTRSLAAPRQSPRRPWWQFELLCETVVLLDFTLLKASFETVGFLLLLPYD